MDNPFKLDDVHKLRRTVKDRTANAWREATELATLAELYEQALRALGLVDYEDMVLYGERLVQEHDSVLSLIRAKFPVLAVDEYQDSGTSLHNIVKRLAFEGGVRLFAVGDPDQSIYGFNGADSGSLKELAARPDVEPVRLEINYRSAGDIVRVAQRALGEERTYRALDDKRPAIVRMVKCPDGLRAQAKHAVSKLLAHLANSIAGFNGFCISLQVDEVASGGQSSTWVATTSA